MRGLARGLRWWSVAWLVVAGSAPLIAQETAGRIDGTAMDPAGAPLAGAQVTLVGTSFRALSGVHGAFSIDHVPAGAYTLRVELAGQATTDVTAVRVYVGEIAVIDVRMGQVAAAPPPALRLGLTTSRTTIEGSSFYDLPVTDPRDVLALQPGVFQSADQTKLSIRGGAAAVYIDGALISRAGLGTNAIEQASVTTGAVGVEAGDAQSGLIAFVTPAGGRRWRAALRYRTDVVGFDAWRSVGLHRIEASAGGPVRGNLSFFTSLTLNGQMSLETEQDRDVQAPVYVMNGIDTIVHQPETWGDPNTDTALVAIPRFAQYSGYCDPSRNNGASCQGLRVPFTATGSYTWQGKLQHTYGTGSWLSLTGLASQSQQRDFPGVDLYDPSAYTGTSLRSRAAILNWMQNLGQLGRGPLALHLNLSYQLDRSITGPLTRQSELDTRSPFGGFLLQPLRYLYDIDYRHDVRIKDSTYQGVGLLDDQQIRCIQAGEGACQDDVPLLNRGDLSLAQPYRMNPYGVEQSPRFPLWTQGVDGDIDLWREARWQARAGLEWRPTHVHRFKLGGESQRIDTRRYNAPFGPISAFGINAYHEVPIRYAAYAEDRLDLGPLVIVGGLRYDHFDSRATYPYTPGRISTDSGTFNPYRPDAKFYPAPSHSALSPQIQASFSLGSRSAVRASYGRQVRTPDLSQLFRGKNTDLAVTNSSQFFGRDLDFVKNAIMELGVQHAFGEDLVLDVALYDQARPAELVGRFVQLPDPGRGGFTADFLILANARFPHTRGIDVRLVQRFSNLFSGSAVYSFQRVSFSPQGAGGDTLRIPRHVIAAWGALTFPDGWRRGTALGAMLQNAGVFATFRTTSGARYTRVFPAAVGYTTDEPGGFFVEQLNASALPSFKTIDVRVTRGFRLGPYQATAFAESRNLLNFTNVLNAFTEVGDVAYPDLRARYDSEQVTLLRSEAAAAGALVGDAVDFNLLGSCQNWQGRNSGSFASGPVDCVLLERAEQRFGNGDGVFSPAEYARAFTAWYDLANAPYRFYGPGRRIRVGLEVSF